MKFLESVNHNHIHFIDVKWYNNCGIVVLFDSITKQHISYISGENINAGNTEDRDIAKVAAHGSTFELEAAKVIFNKPFDEDYTRTQTQYFM